MRFQYQTISLAYYQAEFQYRRPQEIGFYDDWRVEIVEDQDRAGVFYIVLHTGPMIRVLKTKTELGHREAVTLAGSIIDLIEFGTIVRYRPT